MLAVLGLLAWQSFQPGSGPENGVPEAGGARVETAFAERQSGLWLETAGRVVRLLDDDTDGARHQRFIIQVPGGHTLLVAHNIDLAGRIPLAVDDEVSLRGRYEWNARGGVVHWTHHDPEGRHQGGWVSLSGQRYR